MRAKPSSCSSVVKSGPGIISCSIHLLSAGCAAILRAHFNEATATS